MRIESVKIKNFRSFKEQVINFNHYTCLVGSNGSGKSTVLYALNIFFREKQGSISECLSEEDFYHKNTAEPIEITVTFCDLSKEAEEDFKAYCRQGKLSVTAKAVFNPESKKAEVKQYGNRMVMADFAPFFEAEKAGKKVVDLQVIYNKIKESFPDLANDKTKDGMKSALQSYEESHPKNCILKPSEDQFYGISRGANKLGNHVQWVYVPAVKDATIEQISNKNTALEKILERTVRSKINFTDELEKIRKDMQQQYQTLLDSKQPALKDISESLGKKLNEWAHPDAKIKVSWQSNSEKVKIEEPLAGIIAGEGSFEGDLSRFGHGLQRSYLLALLQELAECDDHLSPKLILGCEEPELYQHPPQQKHLSSVLKNLSKRNSQVIVTTHSPLFVSGDAFEDVRLVKKDNAKKESFIHASKYEDIAKKHSEVTGEDVRKPEATLAKIHQSLQPALNEMFFSARLILVEGLEDIAYITTYLHLLDIWDEYRRLGFNIVHANGKSCLVEPLIIANHMNIYAFVVFDSDADKPDKSGSRAKHEKDNKAILKLLNHSSTDYMPTDTIWGSNFVAWNSDIGDVVRKDIGEDDWLKFKEKAEVECGHAGNLEKNSLFIATILTLAFNEGKKSPNLEKLCRSLIAA
jgi:putative ATP-dependent endonuclease of the OLD family